LKLTKKAATGAVDPAKGEDGTSGDGGEKLVEALDGFEGNAQNLRILTYLESRKTKLYRGLHLTRATLDATIKYPWGRQPPPPAGDSGPDKSRKFGIYRDDDAVAEWLYKGHLPESRPVEEQIMDWADDVTYASHDVEDFYRAGLIPLGNLLEFRSGPWSRLPIEDQASPEAVRFLDYVEKKWAESGRAFTREQAVATLQKFGEVIRPVVPYLGLHDDKRLLNSGISGLIRYFLEGLRLDPTDPSDNAGPLNRYKAVLFVPPDSKFACNLLKELIWFYVIHNPGLASQQNGSRRIVTDLLTWHVEEPDLLLPPDRKEEVGQHQSVLRGCCDHVASLTERQAALLYRRMAGIAPGSVTDRLF
jgi:dGTPase